MYLLPVDHAWAGSTRPTIHDSDVLHIGKRHPTKRDQQAGMNARFFLSPCHSRYQVTCNTPQTCRKKKKPRGGLPTKKQHQKSSEPKRNDGVPRTVQQIDSKICTRRVRTHLSHFGFFLFLSFSLCLSLPLSTHTKQSSSWPTVRSIR